MKKTVFILFALIILASTQAQELVVESPFQVDLADLSAASVSGRRVDANGKNCALVKVRLVDPEASFEGNVIEVEYKKGEWWVYLMEGSMNLTIKTHSNLPFEIKFDPLQQLHTYTITLKGPQSSETLYPFWDKKGRVGWINRKGETIIAKKKYADYQPYHKYFVNGYVIVGGANLDKKKNEYKMNLGFMRRDGSFLTPMIYYHARDFSEGLAAVEIEKDKLMSYWGYINERGEYAIMPQFDDASSFHEGLAFVTTKERDSCGYIDKRGKFIIKYPVEGCSMEWIEECYFVEGIAPACNGKKWGYVDRKGNWVIEPNFNFACSFHDGWALVGYNRYVNYVNQKGELMFKSPIFGNATQFHNGFATYDEPASSKVHIIDTNGTLLGIKANDSFELRASVCKTMELCQEGIFSEGLGAFWFRVSTEKYKSRLGYIDLTGRIVIPAQYKHAYMFIDGIALVQLEDESYAYIDKTGKKVFSFNP